MPRGHGFDAALTIVRRPHSATVRRYLVIDIVDTDYRSHSFE